MTYHEFAADKRCFFVRLYVGFVLFSALLEKLPLHERQVLHELIGHFFCHRHAIEDTKHLVDELEKILFFSEN